MARRFFRNLVLGTFGTASALVVLSGGASEAASKPCPQCDLLTVERVTPEAASLGTVGAGNLRDGINIAGLLNRNRSFDRVEPSPMSEMLDPRRNPYLGAAVPPAEQPFLFTSWGAFSPRAVSTVQPSSVFPIHVQPLWGVSQGYTHLGAMPWNVMTFGNPNLDMPMIGRSAL